MAEIDHSIPLEGTEVSVGIVEKGSKILLVQRKYKEHHVLNWQFPAGKIKASETPENAAEREVYEETGVKCTAERVLGHRTHPVTGVRIHYVVCEHNAGNGSVRDHSEIKNLAWVHPRDLKAYIPDHMFSGVLKHFDLAT